MAESSESIETDFSARMSYGDYLGLDALLGAQKPLSDQHDELLFIVIHQVQELWMKLLDHELSVAQRFIVADELRPAFKGLARAGRIVEQLVNAWTVLSTMTPADYLRFRPMLGKSSGFQSWQYRLCEFRLGARDPLMLRPHRHRADVHARLDAVFRAPSLYDSALILLAKRGVTVPAAALDRDFAQPRAHHPGVEAAWEHVYRNSEALFDLYELAEELVDLEDGIRQWRFRHVTTVERIIGMRTGTGGSAGVPYLRRALERVFFPELWTVRTRL